MKTFRTIDGRRVAKRQPTPEEIRERLRFWTMVPAATVGFFLVYCFAAGVIV